MGEPASLGADERRYVADLAEHIIGETERDGDTPITALARYAYSRVRDPAWSLLAMAQEVRRLREMRKHWSFVDMLVEDFRKESRHREAISSGGQHVGHTNNMFTSASHSIMLRFARELRDAGIDVK